jgi:DNA-binding NarL/FixJ family response regulator
VRRARAVIADDHPVTLHGLSLLAQNSGIEVAGEARSGAQALAMCESLRPDIAIVDLAGPDFDGHDVAVRVHANLPDVRVVLMTATDDVEGVMRALEAGVWAFLPRTAGADEVRAALASVLRTEVYVSPTVAGRILRELTSKSAGAVADPAVTERERTILGLLGEGYTAHRIASFLGISKRTVNSHVANLYRRLGVNNRVDAVRLGMRLGLVRAPG